MKKLNVKDLDISSKVEMVESIFDDMHTRSRKLGQSGYLLAGDTGVGKTSFVRDLGILLGMNVVIIETPHIVEEHIIDIPFIVVRPTGDQRTEHMPVDTKGSKKQYDIQFATSHLYTSLTASKKLADAQLLANVKKRADLFEVWKKMGGSETVIPSEIVKLRGHFEVILFLDEYFRQTSKAIRNMLRSILNGRIGAHELPDNIYVIFASNMIDEGVGKPLQNEDFVRMDFDTPDLDQWFSYIIHKYGAGGKVKMDDELLHDMYEVMKKYPGSLSFDDPDTDVRVSPRRWEQLLVYINAALPVQNQRDADLLMKNVEANFRNYITDAKPELAKDVLKVVEDVIHVRHKIKASAGNVEEADWRDTLRHQIETRVKAGNLRKYIPVIGGMPGAGKTTHLVELASDLNMVLVRVDVQNLSPEEILGTPLADTSKKGKIEVDFSKPPMWDNIEAQMTEGEEHLKARLVKFHGKDEGAKLFDAWKKSDAKYIIFFDELNRTDTKVFNAVRKVLLEKEFNPDYQLPEESIMVAAINPTGDGIIELTKHVRDVFDVIQVGISWSKFNKHMDTVETGVSKEATEIARSALNMLVDHFRLKGEPIQHVDPHFFWNIASVPLYISPREYMKAYTLSAQAVERTYQRELQKLGNPDHDPGQSENIIRSALAKVWGNVIGYVVRDKNGIDAPEFLGDLKELMLVSQDISMGGAFKKRVESVKTLKDILAKPFADPSAHLFDDIEFMNYITSVDPVKFKEDFAEFLTDSVINDMTTVMKTTHPRKVMDAKGKIAMAEKEVTKIEYVSREIVHALKLYETSNKLVEVVVNAVSDALVAIANSDSSSITGVLKFSREINEYIKKLYKAATK